MLHQRWDGRFGRVGYLKSGLWVKASAVIEYPKQNEPSANFWLLAHNMGWIDKLIQKR